MMKNKYIKPQTKEILISSESSMLVGSMHVDSSVDNEIKDSGEILSNGWSSENWISTEDEE